VHRALYAFTGCLSVLCHLLSLSVAALADGCSLVLVIELPLFFRHFTSGTPGLKRGTWGARHHIQEYLGGSLEVDTLGYFAEEFIGAFFLFLDKLKND
jgi:hypothetical protein